MCTLPMPQTPSHKAHLGASATKTARIWQLEKAIRSPYATSRLWRLAAVHQEERKDEKKRVGDRRKGLRTRSRWFASPRQGWCEMLSTVACVMCLS